jgi:hypothetical protein
MDTDMEGDFKSSPDKAQLDRYALAGYSIRKDIVSRIKMQQYQTTKETDFKY